MSNDFSAKPDHTGDLTADIASLSPAKRALVNRKLKGSRAKAGEQRNPLTPERTLIALQPQGNRRPFFCVHDLYGDVFCYMHLARYLGRDQPFYGLQARGLNGEEEPLADIKTMAACYIEQIQTVQPEGPYALGGYCSGGFVAFEMAQQLREKGEAVAIVALLDTPSVKRIPRSAWNFLRDFVRDLHFWVITFFSLIPSPRQALNLIRFLLRPVMVRLLRISRLSGTTVTKKPAEQSKFSEWHRAIAAAQSWAMKEYMPRVYPGRVTTFHAARRPSHWGDFYWRDSENGWERLVSGGVDIRVVPGNHITMLQEPHVPVLAEQLRDCLDEAGQQR
jgi:thioesterase domain-containing protein